MNVYLHNFQVKRASASSRCLESAIDQKFIPMISISTSTWTADRWGISYLIGPATTMTRTKSKGNKSYTPLYAVRTVRRPNCVRCPSFVRSSTFVRRSNFVHCSSFTRVRASYALRALYTFRTLCAVRALYTVRDLYAVRALYTVRVLLASELRTLAELCMLFNFFSTLPEICKLFVLWYDCVRSWSDVMFC